MHSHTDNKKHEWGYQLYELLRINICTRTRCYLTFYNDFDLLSKEWSYKNKTNDIQTSSSETSITADDNSMFSR